MASPETVALVIQMLDTEYEHESSDQRIQLWAGLFKDIPDAYLREAALDHLRKSKWYPKAAELRERSRRVTLPSPPRAPRHHPLYVRLYQMVQDCNWNPEEWENLANEMEKADLVFGAEDCRQRARDYRDTTIPESVIKESENAPMD